MLPYLGGVLGKEGAQAAAKGFLDRCFEAAIERVKDEDIEEGEDLCNCEFSLAYGAKILLNNATLHLKRGKRYGLCGPNGVGKSTLMRSIANGQLDGFPPKEELRTVYVEHDIDSEASEMSVVEYVYSDPILQGARAARRRPAPPPAPGAPLLWQKCVSAVAAARAFNRPLGGIALMRLFWMRLRPSGSQIWLKTARHAGGGATLTSARVRPRRREPPGAQAGGGGAGQRGLHRGDAGAAGGQPVGRVEDEAGAGARHAHEGRHHAAGRADQPPGRKERQVAAGLPHQPQGAAAACDSYFL